MRQIRARIREKRGADYTEAELQQLATVKLEKFLDPRGVRSDLVEQFQRHRTVSPEPPKYEFEDTTLYETHRGLLRFIRKLLHPILKLFINPNPLIQALHIQKQVNDEFHKRLPAARRDGTALLRGHPQPRRRNHAARHRGPEPEDARRIAVEPDGLRRAPRASLESVVQYRQPQPRRAAVGSSVAGGRARAGRPARPGAQPSAGGASRRQRRSRRPALARPRRRQSVERRRRTCSGGPTAPAAKGGTVPSGRVAGRPTAKRRRRRRRRPGQNLADSPNAGAASAAGPGTGGRRGAAGVGGFDDGDVATTAMTTAATTGTDRTTEPPISEAGGRGSALRRGHQRRRRTSRAIHRRTAGAARDGRSADDLRARLHHLEERAAAPATRQVNGVDRAPVSRSRGRATPTTSAGGRVSSSNSRIRSPTS